jgi:hypothetical protein
MPLARIRLQPPCGRPDLSMLFVKRDSKYMTKVIFLFKSGVRIERISARKTSTK